MPITPGTRLGPYEVTARIGVGGMGEVYRATDTKLKREVAIKVLPSALASDPERLARFQREAEVLASLNHPNIAAIYGLEESPAEAGHYVRALVMELVEGPTLADRIVQGPIPVDDSLAIARQIAEALEAAHEQGIIHRDLKPANIKVRDDGSVKVLDFGLAKLVGAGKAGGADALSQSPTITSPAMMTGVGVILGTAAYMAPEQARGKAVDKRADIWAFGCVLYEMLTGRRAFEAEDVSETFAAVLRGAPDWNALPADLPPAVATCLRRCLSRQPTERIRDIGDAVLALEGAFETHMPPAGIPAGGQAWWTHPPIVAMVSLLVAGLLWGAIAWAVWPSGGAEVSRFAVAVSGDRVFGDIQRRVVAVSPDGQRLVFTAEDGLHARAMTELEPRVIPGTETDDPSTPVFSPDGEWVAYWAVNGGQLKRIRISGGAAVVIATVGAPTGMSWAPDGTIWLGQPEGLVRVPAAGGTPELMIPAAGEEVFWGPRVLPDGDHVLFSVADGSQVLEAQWDEARIVVQSLSSGERVVVLEGGTEATYLASGHLVYVAGDTLFGVPFDVGQLAVSGVPVPLVQNVLRPDTGQGTAHYDVAGNGTLVYANGSAFSRMLYWVNREGEEEPVGAPPRVYAVPRLSPDESAVALQADGDLWIYSLARGTLERLTADAGRDSDPVWSPDGAMIAYYAVGRDGGPGLFRRAANGTGDVERLAAGTRLPLSWSPDGSRLVFIDFGSNPIANPATAPLAADVDLGVVVFEGAPTLRPLLTTGVREDIARISPDGRWLAVETNETGQMEVFVRPFPQVDGARWRISPAGGNDPIWSRDGSALFYRQDRRIMEVLVIGPNPSAWGRPRPVLELDTGYYFTNGPTHFDVASDGRFLMLKDTLADPGRAPQFVVVLNWREELKRQVPTN